MKWGKSGSIIPVNDQSTDELQNVFHCDDNAHPSFTFTHEIPGTKLIFLAIITATRLTNQHLPLHGDRWSGVIKT